MFANNVGLVDRSLRIFLGLALLVAFFMFPGSAWRYWTLIGVVPLLTGIFGTCPLYSMLGLSTCPTKMV
jgi:hypothetical protein